MQLQPSRRFLGLPIWQFWGALLVVVSGSVGFVATSLLLKLPGVPNCPGVYWPTASASMRLYCAQLEAEGGTVDSLLQAINLVEALPGDHPLRGEINSNVEEWASDILNLGEEKFQDGKLEEAIAIARKIPDHVEAYTLVQDRIDHWNSIWSKAEEAYNETERQLRLSNWHQAFRAAVKLTYIDNKYWSTTKYETAVNKIQAAREESRKLDAAYTALRKGGVDNLFEAIEKAEEIEEESYAHKEAQDLIANAKSKLLKQMQRLVTNRDWTELLQVTNRIPPSLDLQEQISDWSDLARAGSNAELGTVPNLETAIVQAQTITAKSPLYQQTQQLIKRWQLEIEDVSNLSTARQLAQVGRVGDLTAAIAQARLIPRFNPRYKEAQKEIKDWSRQIQIIEDQPLLNRAELLARNRNVPAWQEAISQASLISPNRALYQEAQSQIRRWRTNIEEEQDQPFLTQALALANSGDFAGAITMAQKIRKGRAFHSDAQSKIRRWRREIQANNNFQQARQSAQTGTPEGLSQAIAIARKIPSSTKVKSRSLEDINNWSLQLLTLAQDRADSSLTEAIAIANKIPSGVSAYNSAKTQIEVWQRILNPPPPEEPAIIDNPSSLDSESVPVTEVEFSESNPSPIEEQIP